MQAGLLFSLKTHRELFASEGAAEEASWPMGMTPAFVGCGPAR